MFAVVERRDTTTDWRSHVKKFMYANDDDVKLFTENRQRCCGKAKKKNEH